MENKKVVVITKDPLAKLYGSGNMRVNEISFDDIPENHAALQQEIEQFKRDNLDKEVLIFDSDIDLRDVPELKDYIRSDKPISFTSSNRESLDIMLNDQTPKKYRDKIMEPVRNTPKVGRNEMCPCNSGKKTKKCCK